ncbi:MAG: hypothetical protein AMJ69_01020 [Gammaproteobacteria bacterium SG8_47]|nr:MAG: hypothetical protein AMJ69_01020 [Gammaproteobacteria bacterium SG8_47]
MSLPEVFTAVFAPALLWAAYHYHKDRHQPEPALVLAALYGLGLAAAWFNMHVHQALYAIGLNADPYALAREEHWWELLFFSVFGIGLGEELSKFVPFALLATRLKHFDEPIDGIIYASFVALGFASFENLQHLRYLDGWAGVGRAVASPAVHVVFASIWGYLYGCALLRRRGKWRAAGTGLALAALTHGVYDFIAIGFSSWAHVVPPAILLGLWLWRLYLMRRLQGRPAQQRR